jgi:hypothetical protein
MANCSNILVISAIWRQKEDYGAELRLKCRAFSSSPLSPSSSRICQVAWVNSKAMLHSVRGEPMLKV